MILAKNKKTLDDILNKYPTNKPYAFDGKKPISTKSETKREQNKSSAPSLDDILNKYPTKSKYTFDGKNAPTSKKTTKKYTDFNSETQKAYASAKDKVTSKTTIKSNLSDNDRKKRISEINSELTNLNKQLTGYSRASSYGTNQAMKNAKKNVESRIAELTQERKNLERVGTFSASELKQFEIDDAKQKEASARQKVNSFGARPTAASAEAYKQAISEQYKAGQTVDTLKRQQELYDNIADFGYVSHEDNFTGQWRANYRSSDLSREADKAMSEYIANPTEENKQIAYAYDAFEKAYKKNNEKALDDENVKASWLTKSAAGYLPQFRDQIVPEAIGYVAGGLLGSAIGMPTLGASLGSAVGTFSQSYGVMQGSVYRALLAEGVDEEIARSAAQDEALVSSLIESGETAASVFAMGGTKAFSAIGNAAKASVAKGSTNAATKLVADLATKASTKATAKAATKVAAEATRPLWSQGVRMVGGIAGNGLSEYGEEFTQGAVSEANREKALASIDREIGQYGEGNIDLYNRPIYKNDDGTISTVDSVTYEVDGKYVVLPTIVRDESGKAKRLESDDEIFAHYVKTGEYLGEFNTLEEANGYAQKVHSAQAYYYDDKTVDTDDNLWIGGAKVIKDAVFGGDKETLANLHAQGVEGAKIGLMFGGATTIANNTVANYTNARMTANEGKEARDYAQYHIEEGLRKGEGTQARAMAEKLKGKEFISDIELGKLVIANKQAKNDQYFYDAQTDSEMLDTLVEAGKEFGGQAKKIAEAIEKKTKAGKEVSVTEVKQLVLASEVYKNAEESQPDPLEQAAREVVNERNRVNVEARKRGKVTPQMLESLSRNNEVITNEEVKKVTGFGANGVSLVTKSVNAEGATFYKTVAEVKPSYEAGFENPDLDIKKAAYAFSSPIHQEAFSAGQKDGMMQALADKSHKVVVNENSGFKIDHFKANALPSDVTSSQVATLDLMAKALGVKSYVTEGLKGNAELNKSTGEVPIDATFEREVITYGNKQKVSIVFHAAHEMAVHRVVELEPEAGNAFVYAMYKYLADDEDSVFTLADYKRYEYAKQGVEISLAKAKEEVSANNILRLYGNDEAKFHKAIERIVNGTDTKAKQGLRKYIEILNDIIRKIGEFLRGKSAQERAEIQAELDEVRRLRDMFETAFAKAVENKKAIQVNQSAETRSEATEEPTARENNATNKETPAKAEKQPQKEIRTKSKKIIDRMKIILGDGEKSVGIADGQAYVTNSKDILPSRANRSVFLPVNDVEVAKVEFGANESNKTSANISKILASDSFVPVRKNFVDGTLEGVGEVRVFTDENGREIALETNVAEYFEGYNLEATFRGGKPYAIKATDNDGNIAGVAMAIWMNTSGQKYKITDTTTGIKTGDVFVADKGIKYKILSRDAQNTTVEISSEKGSKTMVIANEVADNNFSNIPKEGITKWIDEDMHIDNRTWEDVGSRSVKAFQFLFPEMQEYYRPLAQELLWDLDNTVKGERILTGSYEMGNQEWTGVERITSDAIATIKDSTNATYDDIRNALNRLINDEGQENIALAKRIELVLDEMLTDGYNTFDGMEIPPNEEYIAKKEELIGKTYEGRPTFDEWNDDLPIFSLKAKGKNAATNSTNNLEIKINEEYNGSKDHSLKWRTDLNRTEYAQVEKWIRRAGNPEYTRITDTTNWYKGRLNGETVFAIYSDKPTILYERRGTEGKAELDILLEQVEEIENGRSIVEVSENINTLLSGDWLQEKHNLANNNAGLGGRGSNTGYATVLQGKSSKFIGSQAFRNVVKNILDIQEEAEASIEKGLNRNKDYSLKEKDQEYLELAKDPKKNEARLRELVDEAAKEAGYIGTYYHGSKSDFTVFKKEFGGASNSNASIGFWFTETEEGARKWADNSWWGDNEQSKVYKTYLRLNNPKVYETVDTKAQREELKKGYENIDKEMTLYDSIYFFEDGRRYHNERYDYDKSKRRSASHTEWEAFKAIVKKYDADHIDYYLEKIPEGERQIVKQDAERYLELSKERKALENQITELRYSDAYELFRTDMYKQIGLGAEDANIGGTGKYVDNKDEMLKKYVDMIKQQGYNGIIIKGTAYDTSTFGENNNQYLVFDSNQAKSAEPVTYDDNGNIIPLSERFNTKNDDIRYSLKDSEGKTLTEAQADYFKDSKVRDAEGNLLVVYHGSPAKFTVFNHKYLNVNGNSHGRGFYFTEKRSLAEGYERKSGQLLKGYLNITNPLSEDKVTIKKSDILKLIKASCNAEAQEYVRDEEYDSVKDALRDTWISNYVNTYETSMDNAYREVANSIYSTNDNDVEMIAELTNAGRSDIVLRLTYDILGYDGVIYTAEDGTHEFVSLVSEQFKSVDNANPTTDPDILYSLKDIKDKYADKTDHLYIYEKKNTISIDNMVVKKEYRNQGIGTAILNDVIDYADRVQKTITLTPTSEFGTKERLKKWYKANGFVENKGRNTDFTISDTMYRLPSSTSFSLKGTNNTMSFSERLTKYVEDGMISTEVYEELIEKYGAIHTGEKPYRDVQVPRKSGKNKKVSQTVRTILEAQVTPDEAVPTIEKMVEDGIFSYEAYSDKAAIANSEKYLQTHGWAETYKDWFDAVDKGEVSKDTTTMGWFLYNNAANKAATTTGEQRQEAIKESLNILEAMVRHQRNAAQALQATRILKKLSPESQLYAVQKSVSAYQAELNTKYGKKAPELQIDEELAEKFLTAETEEERLEAEIEIYKDIGRQMPADWLDRWNAWRYLAMLGNARTHIRNIAGNMFFAPVVATKNLTATAIEYAVHRVSGKKTIRGKSIVWGSKSDRALLQAAWNDYANVADIVSNGAKYNDSATGTQYIEDGRNILNNWQPKWKILKPVAKVTNAFATPLEMARKGNSKALEAEDMWFSKPHYAYALAQYCKANNITAEQIQRGKAIAPAREYAIREAQKATYKDTNGFSQLVSGFGRNKSITNHWTEKVLRTAIEGVLPFRKTPANILVRGVEYSPLGFIKGLADLRKVGKGEMTASEAIDNISAGLTGTGLLALGIYLAAQGLVRGHGEEDKEEKEFKEMMGHQAYSLELPNGESITLDWLAPEALPFFVGVNYWESTKGSDKEVTLSAILQTVSRISEPMLEMSCLQGLNDLFESIGYASSNDTSALVSVLSSATTSYLMQGLPTVFGQIERTGEEERMTTYTEKNDFLTGDVQYTLGKMSAKIPFWDYNQIPYIDAWGRKEASGTALKRGLNNFLNPAYTSTIESSSMENELLRLYEMTGEASVFPKRADKEITVDGEDIYLTADEYVRYATLKGEKSYKAVSDLVKSKGYKSLSNEEKVKAIEDAYDYANQKAKESISNYKPQKWVSKADEFGSNVSSYISFKTEVASTKEANDDKITKQQVADIILDMAQNDSETWKMYLSMYDSEGDKYAHDKGVSGEDYMYFLEALQDVDKPSKSGKYGSYTQDEARWAVNRLDGLTRQEKAILWQSVNTTWKRNPYR